MLEKTKNNEDTIYNYVLEMVDLQETMNTIVSKDWRSKNYPWATAVFTEMSEFVDSFSWKWWKNTNILNDDFDNAMVELVDVFHFLLSDTIERHGTENTAQYITNIISKFKEVEEKYIIPKVIENKFGEEQEDIISNVKYLRNTIISQARKLVCLFEETSKKGRISSLFVVWFNMWGMLGYTPNDIFKRYLIKNTLNIFRQNNGYKDGTYRKLWYDDKLNVWAEDNTVLFKELKDIQLPEDPDTFIKMINEKIIDCYSLTKEMSVK